MSPKSRGRRGPGRKQANRIKHYLPTPAEESLPLPAERLDVLVSSQFTGAAEDAISPAEAEIVASGQLGRLRRSTRHDYATIVSSQVLPTALANPTLAHLAMLRGVQSVADSEPLRKAAADHAAVLVAHGVSDVAWSAQLGQVTVNRCMMFRRPDGAWETLLLIYAYGSKWHGVVAKLQADDAGFRVVDLTEYEGSDKVTEGLVRDHGGDELEAFEPDPAWAHRHVLDAIRRTDRRPGPEPTNGYHELRMLALARCRQFAGSEGSPA